MTNDATQRKPLAESLIADTAGLVSPPQICLSVAEMLQSPNCSLAKLGEVIVRDPNLTARLLRLVNSPFYGLSGRIDTVSRALMVVGMQQLHNLVIAICAVKSFSKIGNKLVNMDTFWRHSIYTGLIARAVAKRCNVLHPERLFIAGLLHDLGSLILYHRLPELTQELLLTAAGNEETLYRAELDTLGFTHAEVGAMLLAQWRIPESLQEAVHWHHEPACAQNSQLETAVLHVSNVLANRSGIGGYCEKTQTSLVDIDSDALALLAPAALDEEAIIGDAGLQFSETAAVLAA